MIDSFSYACPYRHKHGFTLIELAIVLIVLGLLAGGVVTAKDMIYTAKLRKIPVAIEDVKQKMFVFYDKYNALPGDFTLATNYWGADPDGCPTHSNRTAKAQTCNGNGDGRVARLNLGTDYELFRFWQHLKNAGLADGSFTGVSGVGNSTHAVVGENIPIIYDNIGISAYWREPTVNDGAFVDFDYGNVLVIGRTQDDSENAKAFLTPEDAWSLDSKIDDGLPNHGDFLGIFYFNCSTANSGDSDNFNANYDMFQTEPQCAIYIQNAFPDNRR